MLARVVCIVLASALYASGSPVFRYFNTQPNEVYLVKKGDKAEVCHRGWDLPGRTCTLVDLNAHLYQFNVPGHSADGIPFILPAALTISVNYNWQLPPNDDQNRVNILNYVSRLSSHIKSYQDMERFLEPVVAAEMRSALARINAIDIFRASTDFKNTIQDNVQDRINQYGLLIRTANFESVRDVQGQQYFSNLGKPELEQSRLAADFKVAEIARTKDAEIGKLKNQRAKELANLEQEHQLTEAQRRYEIETAALEYQRKTEAAQREFEMEKELKNLEAARQLEAARREKEHQAQIAVHELGKELCQKEQEARLARGRAEEVVQATIEAERQKVEWDARLTREEEEKRRLVQMQLEEATARLQIAQKEAEADRARAEAEAAALKVQIEAFGGDANAFYNYYCVKAGVPQTLAKYQAEGLRDMKPDVTLFGGASGSGEGSNNIMDFFTKVNLAGRALDAIPRPDSHVHAPFVDADGAEMV